MELRGSSLSATSGLFEETTVKETPDLGFNGTSALADFVNQNAAATYYALRAALHLRWAEGVGAT